MKRGKMMKRALKLGIIFTVVATILLSAAQFNFALADSGSSSSGSDSAIVGMRKDNYEPYLAKYPDAKRPDDEIVIEAADFVAAEPMVKVLENFEGDTGKSIDTYEEGYVEWKVNVKEAGFYNIKIKYYPIKGRSSTIEREVWINGESPFFGAKHLEFSRVWTDANSITRDNRDNDLRPRQVESPRWEEAYFEDYMAYYNEPYLFYFKKGENTIRLVSVKEPMVIKSITIHQAEYVPTYEELKKVYQEKGYKEVTDQFIKFQGEHANLKSDPTLYPVYDRTSPATEPYHPSKIRLNTIGGYRWNMPGQWIVWKFDVPESGLYKIALKVRQNMVRGSFTNRKLFIDGKVPFKEMENIQFKYKNDWVMDVLSDENGEPYLFYLEKGPHELKLEVTLGGLAEILRITEDSVYQLNYAYRRILMITGSSPDIYRDYQLEKQLPGVMETFKRQSQVLAELSKKLLEYTGQRGSHAALLDRLSYQLNDLYKRPETIPARLDDFKGNVGSLGTWILSTREQPLEVDYIVVASPEKELPSASVGFFAKVAHEIRAFLASFIEDYDSIGTVYSEKDAIVVWIQTGRDQAQVLKEMIDDSFTPETGIPVNLKLVAGGVLLPSVVAGRAPDVAMTVGGSDPVNYAIRNAVVDLTQFEDFEEVAKRFHPSALTPYRFNNGVFALPETQSFPMLFVRTDIFEELGLEIPQTWEDVYEILPEIQKNHMNFGLPISTTTSQGAGMSAYTMLLYQMGGELYEEDGIASALDTEQAIQAFRKWTEFYVNYKLPLWYDFANRFRIGEIPVGIADYQTYNHLMVSAPEIRGLWEFVPIPGTVMEDGTINRAESAGGACTIMLQSSKNKEAAWEFMKWWTSAEVQVRFGQEMESLMGAAARYPTANMEALSQLPWPVKDYKALMAQWEHVRGNPEVPGGYFTSRHLDNAFRNVVYSGKDPRETLLDYVRIMNEEITSKRKEFGLKIKE